ncbi:MAG TPA: hypothetical protein PK347_08530 [Burkholderiaceae bacterium]|nr:hypothetical protein [Burkholderiaceae bacterium]
MTNPEHKTVSGAMTSSWHLHQTVRCAPMAALNLKAMHHFGALHIRRAIIGSLCWIRPVPRVYTEAAFF